jgi:hypothetical protein
MFRRRGHRQSSGPSEILNLQVHVQACRFSSTQTSISLPSGEAAKSEKNEKRQLILRGDGYSRVLNFHELLAPCPDVYSVGRQRRSSAAMTSPPKTPSRSKCSRALQSPYKEHLPAITRDISSREKGSQQQGKAYLTVLYLSGRTSRLLRCLVHFACFLVALS